MQRRRLLLGLAAGVAGCGERAPTRAESTRTGRSTAPPTTPYDQGPPVAARGVVLRNDGDRTQYVTVVVETAAGATVFTRSREVDPDGRVVYPNLVAAAGTYRVLVETAEGGRAAYDWHVEGPPGNVTVTVGRDVTVTQTVTCAPDCPPFSDVSTADAVSDGPATGATLLVHNESDATRRVRVRLGEGQIDARYRVPPGVTLSIPVAETNERTPVTVTDAAGNAATYAWATTNSPQLRVTLDGEIRITCGDRNRDLELVNEGDTPRRLTVAVSDDGRAVFGETYALAAGEVRHEPDVVRTAGTYRLELATDAGATAGYDWSVCPPRGPVYVVVRPDGHVEATVVVPV